MKTLDLPISETRKLPTSGMLTTDGSNTELVKDLRQMRTQWVSCFFISIASAAKLVRKILNREFVDMSDLLKDSVEFERSQAADTDGIPHVVGIK